MIFSDLDDLQTSLDPDALQITRPVWRKRVWSAPAAYANVLALFCWRDDEAPMVGDMDAPMQHYANNLLSAPQATVSVLKKSFGKANVSVGDKRSPTKPGREKQSTPRHILWSTLRNQGENMRNWDGKPTSALQTRVRELRSKTPAGGVLPGEVLLQFPEDSPPEGRDGLQSLIYDMQLSRMEVVGPLVKSRVALPPARRRRGIIKFIGLCGFDGLAHQNHKSVGPWWTLLHSAA
ncbi:hypothetical protein llap_17491 [Limosa lapponica baueri]|uniref:Uncharacterized protein n=1 Tax=Limosa lapponica baueri TaxID=1758121 RepID=A0A2I0TEK8_LIMLA|nr:hypothetical protein llap_17491 [Limosa lapponica baueri]